jgi:hypothetical protein
LCRARQRAPHSFERSAAGGYPTALLERSAAAAAHSFERSAVATRSAVTMNRLLLSVDCLTLLLFPCFAFVSRTTIPEPTRVGYNECISNLQRKMDIRKAIKAGTGEEVSQLHDLDRILQDWLGEVYRS